MNKALKAVLHNGLFIVGVKDLGKTLVTDTYVTTAQAKLKLEYDNSFLYVTVGSHTELVPMTNVSNLTPGK